MLIIFIIKIEVQNVCFFSKHTNVGTYLIVEVLGIEMDNYKIVILAQAPRPRRSRRGIKMTTFFNKIISHGDR